MTPQKVMFLMLNKVLGSKKIKGGNPKWKNLIFSKTANLIFYLKLNMASVNIMGLVLIVIFGFAIAE